MKVTALCQFIGHKKVEFGKDEAKRVSYRYWAVGGLMNSLSNEFAEDFDDFQMSLDEELPVLPGELYECVLDVQERKAYNDKDKGIDIKAGQKINFVKLIGKVDLSPLKDK